MTSNYNRSEIYSFFDLSEEQQNEALNNSNDQEHAEERSYIIYNHIQGDEVLPLDMFMRLEHSKLFDGVYGQTAFSAYFVKLNKSNDEVLIAYRYD